jgi:riboflavin synthase
VFTGIVEGTGTVARAARGKDVLRLEVDVGGLFAGLPKGGSIAVNGCCLTAVAADARGFTAELTAETLMRTSFEDRLRPGVRVNLERPMRADGRFDGHIVQGHVDAVGRVRELRRTGPAAELVVEAPAAVERYLVPKGSITVDGISLTVAELREGVFTVAVIPYTLEMTNLRDARAGDLVNLEADVIAKYVERLLGESTR